MNKLQQITETLLQKRDQEKANLVKEATEENGYFDIDDYAGGNQDDAFDLGQKTGKAELIEELLKIIG